MSETLTLEEADVQETFFANGWTDGLPVVPPTPGRVEDAVTPEMRCSRPVRSTT